MARELVLEGCHLCMLNYGKVGFIGTTPNRFYAVRLDKVIYSYICRSYMAVQEDKTFLHAFLLF